MTATPRYLVQLSSAEVAFLHALVQRQLRRVLAERPEGRGLDHATAPPELVSLDRRLLSRLREVSDDEQAYFGAGGGRGRPEAARIAEEHAALAEVAATNAAGALGWPMMAGDPAPRRPAGNVVPLHGTSRRPSARTG